jgi:AcrR family transcriptional regulator
MSPRPTIGHIRRPQILAAATEMIYERGLAETRTSDIAERAGVSAPNVLYHFESKDALLDQALAFSSDEWFSAVRPGVERLERASEKIVYLVNQLVAPPRPLDDYTIWIETFARALRSDVVRAAGERDTRRYLAVIETVIREGQRTGEFGTDGDPGELATGLLAMCDGFGVSVRLNMMGVTTAQAVKVILRFASVVLGCELVPARPATPVNRRRRSR